jgi:hypothetical protein
MDVEGTEAVTITPTALVWRNVGGYFVPSTRLGISDVAFRGSDTRQEFSHPAWQELLGELAQVPRDVHPSSASEI